MKVSIILPILLLALTSSCTKSKNNEIIIYYFNNEFLSPTAIECDEFFNEFDISKIIINDSTLYYHIEKYRKNSEADFIHIDARYKIIISQDTLCVNYFGEFIGNEKKGQIKDFDIIKDYIKDFKGKKEVITTPLEEITKLNESDIQYPAK